MSNQNYPANTGMSVSVTPNISGTQLYVRLIPRSPPSVQPVEDLIVPHGRWEYMTDAERFRWLAGYLDGYAEGLEEAARAAEAEKLRRQGGAI